MKEEKIKMEFTEGQMKILEVTERTPSLLEQFNYCMGEIRKGNAPVFIRD